MEILQRQTSMFTEDTSMFSQADFPANRTRLPEKERETRITDTSGRKCLEQLEKFSQVGSLEKTFMGLLIGQGEWYSETSRLTWKVKGLKCSHLLLFQLAPKKRNTEGIDFGLSPTPTATDYKGGAWRKQKEFQNSCLRHFLHGRFAPRSWKCSYPNPRFLEIYMGYPAGWTE